MVKAIFRIFLLIFFLTNISILFSQGRVYEGPDDPAGDPGNRREGWMSGNRVFLYFRNSTELSACCGIEYSRWPNNSEGTSITDGVALLVGARVFVEAENDSIPVTDPGRIAAGYGLDTLYYCQTSYREETDFNPDNTVEWGFHPVKGYFNENDEYIAMSHIPNSWPQDGWPSNGNGAKKWPGEWNGRFGRGVIYAEQETYFVANDAQDQEYIYPRMHAEDDGEYPIYLPRPGVFIGDKDPHVTVQNGMPWGGVGIRAEVRSFQWNNIQARDNIFFEYNLTNISDYDLPQTAFGYWVDNGIGNNEPDDVGYYDVLEDMTYSWDVDGIGQGGRRTGVFGFAFLESPGAAYDNIDNDQDGLVDEKRDNDAGEFVGPMDGISNLEDYLRTYGKTEDQLVDHWEGDEDQDWTDGIDENKDGIYNHGEFYGDDVGLDGVGPYDLNYFGPDEGEGNHKPDYKEGIGCEPNFAVTDISESDMLGLTAFEMFPVPPHVAPFHDWFRYDSDIWFKMTTGELKEFNGQLANLTEFFASGTFPLYKGRTERISMSMLHSYDPASGLNDANHSAPALFAQKEIVDGIYETDYRFAQPPEQPTLRATAMDGKVLLSWDDRADKLTHDPFMNNINDFEGYKLYKSTDVFFQDAQLVTDGYGTPIILKPIFECDIDNEYSGFAPWGVINGQQYYLGDNSGIKHFYIDEDVENGRTYYYGLTAYDYGIPDFGEHGIAPSENNLSIDLDEYGNIRNLGTNVQMVVPSVKAAGYVEADIEVLEGASNIRGTSLNIDLINAEKFSAPRTYKIKFGYEKIDSYTSMGILRHHTDFKYITNQLYIYDITDGDSLIHQETKDDFTFSNIFYNYDREAYQFDERGISTELVDGFLVKMSPNYFEPHVNPSHIGWVKGDSPVEITFNEALAEYFPWEYEIVFTDAANSYQSVINNAGRDVQDAYGNTIKRSDVLLELEYDFYVQNKSFTNPETGMPEKLDLVGIDVDGDGVFDKSKDYVVAGVFGSAGTINRLSQVMFNIDFRNVPSDQMPKPNDTYRYYFNRPIGVNDSLVFRINAFSSDDEKQKTDMKDIKVVPNPYVATNTMEAASTIVSFEQKREIMFTHVPANCTIKIYTSSGVLIDEIFSDNSLVEGSVKWDLMTSENLEIAAGVYFFHVRANDTGKEFIGKFAVIK